MAHIRYRTRQVGVLPECPLVDGDGERSQGCRSAAATVGSHYGNSVNRVIKPQEASSSESNSHRVVKPIVVTTNTSQIITSTTTTTTTNSQTPPIEYCQYFEWRSPMTTMGWITAKTNQFPPIRVRAARWTLHRKARKCRGFQGPATTGAENSGSESNVNFSYSTIRGIRRRTTTTAAATSRSRSESREGVENFNNFHLDEENDETNSVHKFKQNHQTIKHNLRTTTVSDKSHAMDSNSSCPVLVECPSLSCTPKFARPKFKISCHRRVRNCVRDFRKFIIPIAIALVVLQPVLLKAIEASLIIGDSAIEIQEIDPNDNINTNDNSNSNSNNIISSNNNKDNVVHFTTNNDNNNNNNGAMQPQNEQPPSSPQNELIFGSTGGIVGSLESQLHQQAEAMQLQRDQSNRRPSSPYQMSDPLPPTFVGGGDAGGRDKALEDITDGDKRSRNSHDYEMHDMNPNSNDDDSRLGDKEDALEKVFSVNGRPEQSASEQQHGDKAIAGKVVDFELTPAGGHNKAKIKKKKKQAKEEEMFKKWGKKKKYENMAHEKKHKEMMKKKKEEGKKGKKKWGHEEHGLKKKGNFKKKKWAEKVKKGKGVKKGKKGKKFLKDVGHKNTGFKTVYHKEEWGKSSKWHDIKRQKKWDEKSKKWKKKWKKEKGKKYKGDHMKKFEKKKKSGKKYKKESKDKFKKFKKEKFEKGKKKKLEEKSKKKEGGAKMMKEMMKKKKKKY